VTLIKIKIKEVKVKHFPYLKYHYKKRGVICQGQLEELLKNYFTPLEIMPRCSLRGSFRLGERPSLRGRSPSGAEPGPAAAAGLDFRIIPAGFNAPPVESLWVERLEFLTGFTLS
jgi:hypothetical protein